MPLAHSARHGTEREKATAGAAERESGAAGRRRPLPSPRARALGAAGALLGIVAVAQALVPPLTALAHGEEHHGRPGSEPIVQPPLPGVLDFVPPPPGSYGLPRLGAAADGVVLTSDGQAATLHGVFGEHVVLLSFIYVSCSDAQGCPLATAVLQQVGRRLADEPEVAAQLRLVSLSFDPARDTPETMRRYAAGVAVDGVDWHFLTTASEGDLAPLLATYGQALRKERDPEGREVGAISHVLRVFLIDQSRVVRNIYSTSFLHPEALLNDVKTLLLEEKGVGARASSKRGNERGGRALRGPGDDRSGYERTDYRSRSVALAARTGTVTDLLAPVREPPLGLPPVPVPSDNPVTAEKVALGRKLFFDRRLSLNHTFSCAMCHIPEQGFTSNELATAVGIEGRTVRRNAPTLYNVAYAERLFHDGRETRLEHQIWGPLLATNEMGNPSVGAVVERIRGLPEYDDLFRAAFPARGLAMETIGMALASYERTLVSGGSPFDRATFGSEAAALGEEARRGFGLFTGKAGCSGCHTLATDHALFTDGRFHNTGIGYAASMRREDERIRVQVSPGVHLEVDRAVVAQVSERPPSDLGRYEITQDPNDRWRYRTPSLRNVGLTAPYMHDGSLETLAQVVAYYDEGGAPNEGLDPRIRPLGLTEDERRALVAFLESLTGEDVDLLVADAFAAPVGDVGADARPD